MTVRRRNRFAHVLMTHLTTSILPPTAVAIAVVYQLVVVCIVEHQGDVGDFAVDDDGDHSVVELVWKVAAVQLSEKNPMGATNFRANESRHTIRSYS
jgi:hypothetical protein